MLITDQTKQILGGNWNKFLFPNEAHKTVVITEEIASTHDVATIETLA